MATNDLSYLLERQRNTARLRRMAIQEFVQARNSGKLIACVGSYASRHLDYPGWGGLVTAFLSQCDVESEFLDVFAGLTDLRDRSDARFSDVDVMDMAELLAGRDRHADSKTFDKRRQEFSDANFALRGTVGAALNRPRIAAALLRDLGISRIVTLNYDLELECEAFFTERERLSALADERSVFWQRLSDKEDHETIIERDVPGYGRVSSEILVRDDSARLVEFALGAPRDGCRIFHLHGRLDIASSLLVTRRDYRDRYWESGFSKLPFEYGLRLVYSGNPILFLGIGMTEGEVTQVLEQMLSDNPNRRAVPMFLLWNSSKNVHEDDAFRLLFNRKFGVHVLFDREVASEAISKRNYAGLVGAPLTNGEFPGRPPLDRGTLKSARRLEEPLRLLAQIADRKRNEAFWQPQYLRTPQLKYTGKPVRVNVWHPARTAPALRCEEITATGAISLLSKGSDAAEKLIDLLRSKAAVQVMIGDPGSGRGALASAMATAYENHYLAPGVGHGRVVLINASFVTETDSIFSILSGAFDGKTAQSERMSREMATAIMLREIHAIQSDCAQSGLAASNPSASEIGFTGPQARVAEVPLDGEDPALRDATPRATVDAAPAGCDEDDIPPELTVIINGMERFIAHDGSALSTELDSLIRLVTRSSLDFDESMEDDIAARPGEAGTKWARPCFPVRLILMGTPRLLRYLTAVVPEELSVTKVERRDQRPSFAIDNLVFSVDSPSYFDRLQNRFPGLQSPSSFRVNSRRREFLGRVLERIASGNDGITNPNLAIGILRVLAFIGQPTEEHVLLHVPSLWTEIPKSEDRAQAIRTAVDELAARDLLISIQSFPTAPTNRLALHKAMIAEIRQRHGVPISDARLASGFNIGLYTAQPVDSFLPDQRWHQEIGKIVDFLIGQYRDEVDLQRELVEAGEVVHAKIARRRHAMPSEIADYGPEQLARIASPVMTDCLRAALSLMRSYYSTSALLMFGNRDLDPFFNDGPLSRHAVRLARLIAAARITVSVRTHVRAALKQAKVAEIARLLGPEPFYPDDLVWMNNELGLVHTAQGNLIGGREAFEEAMDINELYLDYGERNQNWRRISLNLVQVDIDTGNIEGAEERLRDIESAIEAEMRAAGHMPARLIGGHLQAPFARVRDYVIAFYAHGDCSALMGRTDRLCPTDIIVASALVLGYRGLCLHLRGAFASAEENLRDATAILERLNEQRAYAFFQRHRASLLAAMGQTEKARSVLNLCLAAAGPSRQTDIDHSGRIALVQYGLVQQADRQQIKNQVIPQLIETLRYATTSDMYRIQIEAMQNMALAHFRNGDTDSAMKFATDALAVASRNGFELRKVSLRILLGRIMALRGDRNAGRQLLLSASEIGTKLHYDTAVEKAEDALVLLG